MRGESKCVSEAKHGQSFVCLCVKNGWMKSLSVPRISEQLAKLDQWQSHSVYRHTNARGNTHTRTHTQADSHTYQLCSVLPQWQGRCHTPFRRLMKTHRHAWLCPCASHKHTHTHTPLWGKYTATPPATHFNSLMSGVGDVSSSTLKLK